MCTHQCLVLSVNQLSAPFFLAIFSIGFSFCFLGFFRSLLLSFTGTVSVKTFDFYLSVVIYFFH